MYIFTYVLFHIHFQHALVSCFDRSLYRLLKSACQQISVRIRVILVWELSDLAGITDLEQAQTDMIVDCMEDVAKPIVKILHEKDEAKKVDIMLAVLTTIA